MLHQDDRDVGQTFTLPELFAMSWNGEAIYMQEH
jgi:hypothetical protein